MRYEIIFHPLIETELIETFNWYQERKDGLYFAMKSIKKLLKKQVILEDLWYLKVLGKPL